MKKKKNSGLFWAVFIGVIVVICGWFLLYSVYFKTIYADRAVSPTESVPRVSAPPHPNFPPIYDPKTGLPQTVSMIYPADPTNNQILLGASHNVFVAKVVSQSGNKVTEIGPRTQYLVDVVENIKGDISGEVTLDMYGGYENGQLVAVEGMDSDYSLITGATYVFATRYNEKENWYTLIPHPNARKLINTDVEAKNTAVISADKKVQMFREAYVHEILDGADISNNNTRNSFQSLPGDKKAEAESRATEAKAALDAAKQGTPAAAQ